MKIDIKKLPDSAKELQKMIHFLQQEIDEQKIKIATSKMKLAIIKTGTLRYLSKSG